MLWLSAGGLCEATIANQKDCNVVSLARSAGKFSDRFENSLLKMIHGRILLAGENSTEAGNSEHLLIGVHGLGNAVTKEDECVVGLKLHAGGDEIGLGDEADRKRAVEEGLKDHTAPEKKWRGMPGINEIDTTVDVQNAEKHGGIAADLGMLAQK